MKKLVCLILPLIMIFFTSPICVSAVPVDAEVTEEAEIEYYEGKDVLCSNIEILDNGFVAVLTSVSESETVPGMERSYPEKEKTAVFTYTILDRNGEELGTFTATVKGIYSEADRETYLTSMTGTFSGTYASSFSYTSSINGQTGSVNIYFDGIKEGTFSYRIHTNGNIQNL